MVESADPDGKAPRTLAGAHVISCAISVIGCTR
jgi:hypothetical protein